MKKVFKWVLVLVLMVGLTGCFGKKETDALKFKQEYEALNDQTNQANKPYRSIKISEDNPFVYADAASIVDKINKKETFYVYFGSAYCPWCRSVMESLIKIAQNIDDPIYYVNIWEGNHVEILRDQYELDEEGRPRKILEGDKNYPLLLSAFADVLSDYTLTNADGEKVSVGEKRIMAPNIIYVENGIAKKIVTGISSLQTASDIELSDEILKDQEKLFAEFFKNDITCDLDKAC